MAHFFQIKKLNTSYHKGIEFFDFKFVTQFISIAKFQIILLLFLGLKIFVIAKTIFL